MYDMVFAVCQLVEMSWEHRAKSFLVFIESIYDSVPRDAMWLALGKLGVPDQTIQLIRSFHHDMSAQIHLDGSLSEPIDVANGLRQGCCMAPVLFNLYTYLVVEQWCAKVGQMKGVGVELKYKYDGKLFRRYVRNADESRLIECLFADDDALLATTRSGAERAVQTYQQVSRSFGLSVSIPKTKYMATGREVIEDDKGSIPVDGGEIESVDEFPYLGSMMKRIAQASRAFGALHKAVFMDRDLKLETKHKIYQACVLSVLMYGSECWVLLRQHVQKIDSFHHRCIRIILGITNRQWWSQHITNLEIRKRWGDLETAADKVTKCRLEWLGHLARMPSHRMPK